MIRPHIPILLFLVFLGVTAQAQRLPFSFYYQNVPSASEETPFSPGGFGDFNRFRVMGRTSLQDLAFEMAYEQLPSLMPAQFLGGALDSGPTGSEWLDLQWTIHETEDFLWRHRFDRLNVTWTPTDSIDVTVGRQTVSWATTLFLTPADPFTPFNPADPFREFRSGVDAMRLQIHPSPLSSIEFVARPTRTRVGEEMTALTRGLTAFRGWELSGWGGVLYGEAAGAAGAAGSLFTAAVRAEISLREKGDDVAIRSAVGLDRLFQVYNRDLYLVVEYQHDAFGASTSDEYGKVLSSNPFLRGELQALGRDETALQLSYQLTPLWSIAFLGLANLNDSSQLISPSFSYSLSNEAALVGGVFRGLGGDAVDKSGQLRSEYGGVGTIAYLSLSVFF